MGQKFSKFISLCGLMVASVSMGSFAFADDDTDFKKAFRDLDGKPAISTELTEEQKAILARAAAKKAAAAEVAAQAKAQKIAREQELAEQIRQKVEADKLARAEKAKQFAIANAEKLAAEQREKQERDAKLKEEKAQALQRQADAKAQMEKNRADQKAKEAQDKEKEVITAASASSETEPNIKHPLAPEGLRAISKIRAAENKVAGGAIGRFSVRSGDDLQAVITRWAGENGWTVQWKSDYAFAIAGNAGFGPDFKSAVQGLINAMQEARPAPAVDLYPDNKMVVVLDGLTAVR